MNRIVGLGIRNTFKAGMFSRSIRLSNAKPISINGLRFNSTNGAPTALSWNKFLDLRKQERRLNLYSSIATAFVGATVGWAYISQVELDSSLTLFGFDPILVLAVTLVGSSGLGYLSGPLLGSALFKTKNKSILHLYQQKNSLFLKHIIKNRVDASRQSFSNPVPDFYGEKITSLKEYKQWLRDCNAYRRKVGDLQ